MIEAIEEDVEDDENNMDNETLPSCKGSENILDDYYSSRTDADDDDDDDDDDDILENGDMKSTDKVLENDFQTGKKSVEIVKSKNQENDENTKNDNINNKKKTTIVNKEIDQNNIENRSNMSHSGPDKSHIKPIVELIENEMLSNSLGRAGDVYRSLRNK